MKFLIIDMKKYVVVEPSPEILKDLIAACSNNSKLHFQPMWEISKALISKEPEVIILIQISYLFRSRCHFYRLDQCYS